MSLKIPNEIQPTEGETFPMPPPRLSSRVASLSSLV